MSVGPIQALNSKKGMSAENVAKLQTKLGVPDDGKYGPKTEAAVKAFQKKEGLTVDGIAGKKTVAALDKDSFEDAKAKPLELVPSAPPAVAPPTPPTEKPNATYTVGLPTQPPIQEDNGFLQNPSNPNDPNPIATQSPTLGDRANLAIWKGKLEAAEAIQGVPYAPHNDIPDGLAAYRHFLEGNGAPRTFSYERYVANDPSGKTTLQNATRDIQLGAEQAYADMIAKDPSLKGKPVTFQITGSGIPVGSDSKFPYPKTENWQKAIGAHNIWMSGTVTVTPPSDPSGKPSFSMDTTLHAQDRYNLNPGAQDVSTGTPDADNGRFEQVGLAHQYENTATLHRQVSWITGEENPSVNGGTEDRKPSDNRRARNRI